MREAADVVAGVGRVPGLSLAALVPNPKGAENAAKAGIDEMAVFISASESHNKSNLNRTIPARFSCRPRAWASTRCRSLKNSDILRVRLRLSRIKG
jgi:hydroxymethylglutaryl-CoA lyase